MSAPAGEDDAAGEAGFALAEVLVAFAILALVSLAMLRAFAGTTGIVAATASREARLGLAQALVEEARARPALAEGLERGEEEGLAWAMAVSAVAGAGPPAPAGGPRPVRLAVSVAPRPGFPADPAAPLLVTLALAPEPGA